MASILNQSLREKCYIAAIGAIALDLGSTTTVTLRRGSFAEYNPIAQCIGLPGTIVYGLGILALVSFVLMKWGLDWARREDKGVFFTDLIGIEVFISGIFDFLHNYGFIYLIHSYTHFYIFTGASFSFAALVSLLINRHLLFHIERR